MKLQQDGLVTSRKLRNQRNPEEQIYRLPHSGGIPLVERASKDINRRRNGRTRQSKIVSLEELMLTTLAQTDALTKLLLEKGIITDAEFKQKLLEERAVYQRILNPTTQ